MEDEWSVVNVWVGWFASRDPLDDYFAETYHEDPACPLNQFAADLGAGFYDHDFVEHSFQEDASDVLALLAGHSFSDSYAQDAASRWREGQASESPFRPTGAPPLNSVVLAWGEQFARPSSVVGSGYELHYLGQFACSAGSPKPLGPEVPTQHHSGRVEVARFVNGDLALTGAAHGEVRFWNTHTGSSLPIAVDQSPKTWVLAAACSPDGSRVVTCSDEVVSWSPASADPKGVVLGDHQGYQIYDVAITPDGALALSASDQVGVWDLALGTRVSSFRGHGDTGVRKVVLLGDRKVASVDSEGTLLVWSLEGNDILERISIGGAPKSVCWSQTRGLLVAGLWNGKLVGWRRGESKLAFEVEAHQGPVQALGQVPGAVFSVGDTTLKRWDLDSGRESWARNAHTDSVLALALGGESCVFTGARDATVRAWDTTGTELARVALGPQDRPPVEAWLDDPYEVRALAVDPSGTRVVAGEASGRVHLLRFEAGELQPVTLGGG